MTPLVKLFLIFLVIFLVMEVLVPAIGKMKQ